MNTYKFADGRIKLFTHIMLNLGGYTCFQYGPDIFVSIAGNEVSFCTSSWHTMSTVTIN